DPPYAQSMNLAMNWWFIIVSVFRLTIIGTWVPGRVVEPRLGEHKGEYREKIEKMTKVEKKGMVWATIALVVAIILVALLMLPEGAPMRGEDGGIIQSPFMDSLVPIIAILFFVPGLVYGMVTKAIKNDKDVAGQMTD